MLIGIYSVLNGVFGNCFEGLNYWIIGMICGGDVNKGIDFGDYFLINLV